jgi:hypothetical protein
MRLTVDPIQILNITRPKFMELHPSANESSEMDHIGSIIILTSLVTASNYQTVLVDLNRQNRCLES